MTPINAPPPRNARNLDIGLSWLGGSIDEGKHSPHHLVCSWCGKKVGTFSECDLEVTDPMAGWVLERSEDSVFPLGGNNPLACSDKCEGFILYSNRWSE